jgi:abequosyltransferase
MQDDGRISPSDTPSPPRLSVCIPTYNFAAFIPETIRSIVKQDGASEIELIVVDGASTDDTPAIMTKLQSEFSQISYIRLAEKGGIDRDIANTVKYATGEYCWLFSSDDVMHPGALRRMLNEIDDKFDVYVCRHMECTIDMEPLVEWPALNLASDEVFDLSIPDQRRRYFGLALTTEPFFSFMSGLVVKRSTWNSIPLPTSFLGTCWAHAARLFSAIPNGLTVKYISEPLLSRRGENDSFSDLGIVNRFRIAIDGYNRIANTYFGNESIEAFHIRRVLKRELNIGSLLLAKSKCGERPDVDDKILLDHLVKILYIDRSFRSTIETIVYKYFPSPRWLLDIMRRTYRLLYYRRW